MDISSIKPGGYLFPQAPSLHPDQAAQRRQLIQAVKSVNESGSLGDNELVFLLDRQTHRSIIRVENKQTHEVVFQVPPQYVLNLAQQLDANSAHTTDSGADT
jgi:uncharacterized FlaG/YvyC family protein